ncbi:MAG: hypothetical protein ACK4GU_13455 [Alishewanella aestuarii]
MGGSSSRNTSSQSSSNTSVSYGIQNGTGIWGDVGNYDASTNNTDVFADFSDRSVTDIFQDNSDRSITELSGQFAGLTNNGSFSVTDGGAFKTVENVAYAALSANSDVAQLAISSGNNLARDLAGESNLLARESLLYGGTLAKELFATTRDLNESKDNFMNNAQRYAYQFADNASRSDGQQLAIQTNKTMLYIALAAAGVVAVVALKKG